MVIIWAKSKSVNLPVLFWSFLLPHFHISQVPHLSPFQAGLMKPRPSLPISPKQRWVGRFWAVLGTAPGGGRMQALGSAADVGFAWHMLLLFSLAARFFSFKENWRMSALRVSSRARWVRFQKWGIWVVHCSDLERGVQHEHADVPWRLLCPRCWHGSHPALRYTWLPPCAIGSALSEKGSSVVHLCFSHNHETCFSVSWEKVCDPRQPSPVLNEGAREHLGTSNY